MILVFKLKKILEFKVEFWKGVPHNSKQKKQNKMIRNGIIVLIIYAIIFQVIKFISYKAFILITYIYYLIKYGECIVCNYYRLNNLGYYSLAGSTTCKLQTTCCSSFSQHPTTACCYSTDSLTTPKYNSYNSTKDTNNWSAVQQV